MMLRAMMRVLASCRSTRRTSSSCCTAAQDPGVARFKAALTSDMWSLLIVVVMHDTLACYLGYSPLLYPQKHCVHDGFIASFAEVQGLRSCVTCTRMPHKRRFMYIWVTQPTRLKVSSRTVPRYVTRHSAAACMCRQVCASQSGDSTRCAPSSSVAGTSWSSTAHQQVRELFDWAQPITVATAPGRLDVMGGIADYSGSLVLQLPIGLACHVAVQMHEPSAVGVCSKPNPGHTAWREAADVRSAARTSEAGSAGQSSGACAGA
jgi:Galactokinase galactose-binding signature